ncbi:MAG: hypothetical protein CMI12_08550 [Oceanospirillum sp.]|nr:hypothetical protein [Oceanospirillum sp.]
MVAPHKPLTPEVLTQPADYGVLKLLEGTWVNHNPDNNKTGWGLHTTCVPSPGSNPETIPGKFHFLCEDYTEELTFTLVPGGIRNRGGANEQFCGAVKYEQSIQNLAGEALHEENGMFLWLDNLYSHPATEESIMRDIGFPEMSAGDGAEGPVFIPPYSICRSGTIPHGSTVNLLGSNTDPILGKPRFPKGLAAWDFDHLAISRSMGGAGNEPINLDEPAPPWVDDKSLPDTDPSGNKTYTQRILANELYPYSVRPDLRLRDALKNQEVKDHILIDLASNHPGGPQGGVLNIPFVQRNTPVADVRCRIWLETVIENGEEIHQLQYEQTMFFEFQFGTDGGTTRWPHIQINTLRKKV